MKQLVESHGAYLEEAQYSTGLVGCQPASNLSFRTNSLTHVLHCMPQRCKSAFGIKRNPTLMNLSVLPRQCPTYTNE